MQETPELLVETAKDAVRVHAEAIKTAFLARNHAVTSKVDHTIVTTTDTEAEQAMRALIAARYPTHDILGEEFGESIGSDASHTYRWALDPIDGTRNFTYGVPLFVSAAAVLRGNELIAAATYHPLFDELLWATAGGGAFRNGVQITLAPAQPLASALINFDRHRSRIHEFTTVIDQVSGRIGSPRVFGSALYTMGKLACGSVDAMLMLSNNLWDIAPGLLIAKEAGALGIDFTGQPWTLESGELILAHPDLAAEIVTLLQAQKEHNG